MIRTITMLISVVSTIQPWSFRLEQFFANLYVIWGKNKLFCPIYAYASHGEDQSMFYRMYRGSYPVYMFRGYESVKDLHSIVDVEIGMCHLRCSVLLLMGVPFRRFLFTFAPIVMASFYAKALEAPWKGSGYRMFEKKVFFDALFLPEIPHIRLRCEVLDTKNTLR